MAYASINFHHPQSGRIKTAPVGFSWTTLFFGFFPALLRSHWVGALAIFLLCFVTWGLAGVVFSFFYNKWYVRHLISEGFKATSASQDLTYLGQRLKIALPVEAPSKVAIAA